MAAVQEPEVQLAQRLASNEKAVRIKAMKKLRKYISARSLRASGGFTGDELLKLWKGLFYCLWMQDKALLQEELSNQISTLIHNFHDLDKQLMYLESFLQTMKREWTGIDRLRMDKFYQLVRFVFRQSFDVLRRRNWESSAVGKFLELLKCHLLQNDSETPSGLLLHILDLYMTELAAVGAGELTADQNLIFIEPFCRKAAKTKNHALFSTICKSLFSTIIEQAPFAVGDLMKEVKTAQESDSGQESEEDDEQQEDERRNAVGKSREGRLIKGSHLKTEEESDEELLHLGDSDAELSDEDFGPVLQFDYSALADKLFELASRSNTPGHNRHKLYRVIKVLRGLSEGIFPQDEYPEEVSTDEDDDMFGSRKRMKRPAHNEGVKEKGIPTGKKSKADTGKKQETFDRQSSNMEPVDAPANNKKKKKKKKTQNHNADSKSAGCSEHSVKQSPCSTSEALLEAQLQLLPPTNDSEPMVTDREQHLTSATSDTSSEAPAGLSGNKKKKKRKILKTEAERSASAGEGHEASVKVTAAALGRSNKQPAWGLQRNDIIIATEAKQTGCDEASGDNLMPKLATTDAAASAKKSQKMEETIAESRQAANRKNRHKGRKGAGSPQITAGNMQLMQKRRKCLKLSADDGGADPEQSAGEAELISSAVNTRKRKITVEFEFEADELEGTAAVNSISAAKNKTKKSKVNNVASEPSTPQSLKKTNKKNISGSDFIIFPREVSVPPALYCKINGSPGTPAASKKRQLTPTSDSKKVTFGLKNNKTAEFKKTDRSLLLSPEGLSRVPFDPQQKPKFGVLKSPPTTESTDSRKTSKSAKKAPNFSKKISSKSLPNAPKRRPSAADFF
ncbi:ribosomal RNA processing protein 1 homolog A isoform X1 [Xiphophorus couchianus]|uniref:ribosomal RNA processing protein 1 homolog A isoform X1 n=1 Tax=Xiphophorus couchianus TaxID=32473 RepID=UPI001015FA88|nr:ribosomal RNA processing protein 1 homolog B isoform X1 [Xiphophorus couchianus]